MKTLLSSLFLLVVAIAGVVSASDLEKEARWRAQVEDALLDGEAVDLTAGDVTFLGIYTESDEITGRAAIIAHGIGIHPDWPQVVSPLRTALPQHGWSTLSIQMPVLPNEASAADYAPLLDEVAPRMDAAIAYLRSKGADRIAIIAHSLGATMAADYLASHPGAAVAFVSIGMGSGAGEPRMDTTQAIRKITTPTLDLFGQNDNEDVLAGAQVRAEAAQADDKADYYQVQVPEADHFFDGREEALTDAVVTWLGQTVPVE